MLVISVSVSVQQVECQYAVRTRNVPRWLVRLVAPELVVLARSLWYSRLRCRYSNLAVTWLQSGQWLKAVEAGRHAIIWAGWVYSVDAAFLARHGVRMERVISQLALSVANLRRTAHSTGSSAGNLGDVQRFEHSPSVAVVTLCAYNASSSKLAQLSMSNKVRYCRIHSCTFVPFTERLDADRPIPWSKVLLVAFQICVSFSPWHGQILALQEVLHRQGVEWVMWMDCDSFFMNFTISPSSMLARLGAFSANNPDVWLTEDGVMINSGASASCMLQTCHASFSDTGMQASCFSRIAPFPAPCLVLWLGLHMRRLRRIHSGNRQRSFTICSAKALNWQSGLALLRSVC